MKKDKSIDSEPQELRICNQYLGRVPACEWLRFCRSFTPAAVPRAAPRAAHHRTAPHDTACLRIHTDALQCRAAPCDTYRNATHGIRCQWNL